MSRSSSEVSAEFRDMVAGQDVICVELTFSDDPRRFDARPAHRERVRQLYASGDLLAAGPWTDDSGALLVFKLDEAAVRKELAADPYYSTPGITVVSVHPWNPH
ncbi:MAG: hypothetical protein JO345_38775 [Streptosporangiaceae bacterium]|nr:hypothetical protein [Streptosporangiaceae bacterium]